METKTIAWWSIADCSHDELKKVVGALLQYFEIAVKVRQLEGGSEIYEVNKDEQ